MNGKRYYIIELYQGVCNYKYDFVSYCLGYGLYVWQ